MMFHLRNKIVRVKLFIANYPKTAPVLVQFPVCHPVQYLTNYRFPLYWQVHCHPYGHFTIHLTVWWCKNIFKYVIVEMVVINTAASGSSLYMLRNIFLMPVTSLIPHNKPFNGKTYRPGLGLALAITILDGFMWRAKMFFLNITSSAYVIQILNFILNWKISHIFPFWHVTSTIYDFAFIHFLGIFFS